jgi:1,4-alpha-glucan branching enzyme
MKTVKVSKKTSSAGSSTGTASLVCGIKQLKNSVVFTAFYPSARTVQIAGDFNNWQPQQNPMEKIKDKGYWQAKLPLAKGTYRYRLVVDGQWQQDPNNSNSEPNPYGGLNSVLSIN